VGAHHLPQAAAGPAPHRAAVNEGAGAAREATAARSTEARRPEAGQREDRRPEDRRAGARGSAGRLSVAPMMAWTDRHFRRFLRQLTRETRLYTEMVTTGALLHGDVARHLEFDERERPLVLQLGGDDPAALARCAALAERWGYDELNLNVGCPSDRVQRGRFGACLMASPGLVAASVEAMRSACGLPVTVKHRLGIDDLDDDEHLGRFVDALVDAGVDGLVVHARKAWLTGLSPKANRSVPPLQPERVLRLKAARPQLRVELNGGVRDLAGALGWLAQVDGVMIGRAAYEDPWLLAEADARVFGRPGAVEHREGALREYLPYVEARLQAGTPLAAIARHLLGLFAGRPGARAYRRVISERAHRPGAGIEVLEAALAAVPEAVRREPPGALPSGGRSPKHALVHSAA
jgi:tRNA-dihydrouridine synthase A